jgi:hypothetical protein
MPIEMQNEIDEPVNEIHGKEDGWPTGLLANWSAGWLARERRWGQGSRRVLELHRASLAC